MVTTTSWARTLACGFAAAVAATGLAITTVGHLAGANAEPTKSEAAALSYRQCVQNGGDRSFCCYMNGGTFEDKVTGVDSNLNQIHTYTCTFEGMSVVDSSTAPLHVDPNRLPPPNNEIPSGPAPSTAVPAGPPDSQTNHY